MSLISRSLEAKQQLQPLSRTAQTNMPAYRIINGRLVAYDDNRETYIIKGYNLNDHVYSIINLITNKAKEAPWGIYKIENENSYKALQSICRKSEWSAQDFVKAKDLHRKALKPVENAGKWGELLQYPNDTQTFPELVGDAIMYKLLVGNAYIYGRVLKGGVNGGMPYDLNNLPAQWTNIIATDLFPVTATGYWVNMWPDARYTPQEVMHLRTPNPNWNVQGQQLYGMAPLKAGLRRLQKNNSLTEAEAAMYANQGVNGVLHMKATPGSVDGDQLIAEVQALKETLTNEWEGAANKGKIGLSAYDVAFENMGLTAEEMAMIESGMVDLRYLCNIFGGVPSQLLNDPTNKHYNNYKEGEKALTSRCVMPHLTQYRDNLNRMGQRSWGMPKGTVADFDVTVFSELQADVKETADWTSKLIAIIPNEQRELCGLAAVDDPQMNEPWVTSMGRQPLTDYQLNDVDNALNAEDGAAPQPADEGDGI